MDEFLKELNLKQREAVEMTDGPILILAGAGSGKTRVLTYKVAYLSLFKKIDPANILLLTFTNKAAGEMKERVSRLMVYQKGFVHPPYAGTFHSFCAKFLRKEGKYIGLPVNYIIYDQQDQLDVVKDCMMKLNISPKNFHPSAILNTISEAKNELITEAEYPKYARGHFQETVAQIYSLYQKTLKNNYALDFDDLLIVVVDTLKNYPEILEKYQDIFRYVLIDEYQDTNRAQYTLSKLLAGKYRNICVVGDASQSIYSWRGADYRNLVNFQKDYPDLKVFYLEENYRSTQKILNGAFSVISKNSTHPILSLWTKNGEGDRINIYQARNEQDEASFIARELVKEVRNKTQQYHDFAVLYRTNAQSRVVEEVFLHLGIPYVLVGGVRFYERKEIKDVLSMLRFISNDKDSVSFKRITKLGKGRLNKFIQYSKVVDSSKLTTLEILDSVVEKTGYLEMYDDKNEEDLARLENIKELRSVASEFTDLSQFLENVALVEQEYFPDKTINYKGAKDAVSLMTLHAAKGLEFNSVFMVGMEEGIFPHSRSLLDRSAIEEERRLCYVGITRAKKKLYLTYATRRLFFGLRSENIVSRFICDIPEELLLFVNGV